MRSRPASLSIAVTSALLVAACTSATSMVHTWTAPDFQKASVKKILVLGVAKDGATRRSYEDGFVSKLKALGYQAVPGYLWAPDATKIDHSALNEKIHAEGVTHVLVTRLAAIRDVQTTVPTTVYTGPAYYGGWYSYYSWGYTTMVSPGYTVTNQVVTLETNFYDTAKKEESAIVWSGTSDTWRGDTPASNISSVISTLLESMRSSHVL